MRLLYEEFMSIYWTHDQATVYLAFLSKKASLIEKTSLHQEYKSIFLVYNKHNPGT